MLPQGSPGLRRTGTGNHAIVLVPGALDSTSVWDELLPDISACGAEVIQVSLQDLSGGELGRAPFTLHNIASGLAQILDQLGKPTIVVGHGLGALIVELAASRSLVPPHGLVLVAPSPLAGAQLAPAFLENCRALSGKPERVRQVRRSHMNAPPPRAVSTRLDEATARLSTGALHILLSCWDIGDRTSGNSPSQYRGSVLALAGERDRLCTPHMLYARVLPRFERPKARVIRRSGHWPQLEQPTAVAQHVAAFVATTLAPLQ
ncbi:alpha/beta hydrolase [Streptomyces sp. NPDC093228]|uniref:alpha/beta fold hydrolase n=1 Tax=Streptomyces sp. NPDC093228 TaxID=3155070 RepID=UPI00341ABEBB